MFRRFLFYFIFNLFPFILDGQVVFSLDWEERRPNTEGRLINHDSNNSVIVCGRIYDSTNFWSDIVITKHSKNGTLDWDTIYKDPLGDVLLPKAMAIDSANNIYIAGIAHANLFSGNSEGFLIKYTPQGILAWERFFGFTDSLYGGFSDFKIANNKYIYITGSMAPIYWNGPNATVLVKYDTGGNRLWSYIDSLGYSEEGVRVETDKAKNVYVIGTTSCCLPYNRAFVAKYDSSGNKRWQTTLIDTFYVEGFARHSAIDDSSNIYVGFDASAIGFATRYDVGYAKVDSSGVIKWLTTYDNFQNTLSDEFLFGINFDKSNNSIIYGFSSQSGLSSQGFLAKYDSKGHMRWYFVPDTVNFPFGFFLITCSFYNDSTILGMGNQCLFSLDTSGTLNWRTLGLPVNYYVSKGEIYDSTLAITGYYHPDLSIEDSMVVTQIHFDEITGVVKTDIDIKPEIYVYPNPFAEKIIISNVTNTETRIRLINAFGETIYETYTSENRIILTGSAFLPGLYFLEISNDSKRNILKLIKQ
jgi:hypothetical protein